jgi:hypothetical protein
MNAYFRWYSRLVWFGLMCNLGFAAVALWAPTRLQRAMRLKPLIGTVWLRNVGMLLVNISIFNAGAALRPARYPLYSYLVCVARLIAGLFFYRVVFFNPEASTDRPRAFSSLWLFDSAMGVLCAVLLTLGLRREKSHH